MVGQGRNGELGRPGVAADLKKIKAAFKEIFTKLSQSCSRRTPI